MNKFAGFLILFVLLSTSFGAETVSAQKKTIKKTVVAKRDWSGDWTVPSRFAASNLSVKMLSPKKFEFVLEAYNGANAGEISGTAVIRGAKAFYDDRAAIEKDAPRRGCRLTFTHEGDLIDVAATTECQYYAGNAVLFSERYQKNTMLTRESDFVYLKVFPDKKLDWEFRLLTGRDYEKFLDSFHIVTEEENEEAFGAKIFSACVRGICSSNAAIVMFDETNRIWAAVVYPEEGEKTTINYYTNVADWKDKMPKTIDAWVADKKSLNENVTVNFKNKE
jgi:hypothetical protein